MSSTFKFHSTVGETVPWNATYAFPTQATKVQKSIVKIPTKTGSTVTSSSGVSRIEFPSDGYLNMLNSVLQFDVKWSAPTNYVRFQRGGAHNLIKRLRVLYGSLVIEDIQEYKTLVRLFTEVGVQQDYSSSTGGILDGMTSAVVFDGAGSFAPGANWGNIIGDTASIAAGALPSSFPVYGGQAYNALLMTEDTVAKDLSDSDATRTYCLNLLSGLLTCKKLIPLKWMASQLAIEITWASEAEAALYDGTPTYAVSNINFIAEMLDFDSSYDKAFFLGLQQGIPLKFSSWHYHQFSMSGAIQTFQIHERSRSVKAAFAVVRTTDAPSKFVDSDVFYHAVGQTHSTSDGAITNVGTGYIKEFQWRVGGKYYPAQPVRATNGGAEALVELLKTVNALGNYTVASQINYRNWTSEPGLANDTGRGTKFIMACEFENTDVMPDTIAGINAEEQSDIALTVNANASATNKKLDVFIHYDTLIIVREGNVVDLVL